MIDIVFVYDSDWIRKIRKLWTVYSFWKGKPAQI